MSVEVGSGASIVVEGEGVVGADEAVTGEVNSEGDTQEGVGEGSVIHSYAK
jgi:hypothetical protein